MFKIMNERKKKRKLEFQDWLDGLDEESAQETVIKYLRKLDVPSLKRLYKAVDFYRLGDQELKKVKDPEEEEKQRPEDNQDGLIEEI